MFDYEIYETVKPYLKKKDRRYIDALVDKISACDRPIRFLDVGAFDLRNLIALEASIPNDLPPTCISAIEPDPPPGTEDHAQSQGYCFHPITIQELLLQPEYFFESSFDVISMQNLFYHILPAEWCPVVQRSESLLGSNGQIVVSLVSKKSSLYDLLDKLIARLNVPNAERTFAVHGAYIFFEDFCDALTACGIPFEVDGYIAEPINLFSEAGSRSQTSASCVDQDLLNKICFFGRVKREWVASRYDDIMDFLEGSARKKSLSTIDGVLTISKRNQ